MRETMKIFLSSTYEDLVDHREAAARAIERLKQQPVRMEAFGARPSGATSACLEEISDSDTLIGLYAHRYGYTPNGQSKSITEQEFDFAMEKEKPILCFVVGDDYPWPPKHMEAEEPGRTRLREFLKRIREKFVKDTFTDPVDLAFKVSTSLACLLLKRKAEYEREKIPALRGARLLIVNDSTGKMPHVSEMLRDLGLDVQVISSDGALWAISNETYDLVVLDVKLDAGSPESLKILNSIQERGIFVVLTGGRFNFDPTLPPPPAFNICLNYVVLPALKRMRASSG